VFGRFVIAIGVFLFGLTTSSGIYAQIEVVVRYIIGDSPWKKTILKFYKWTYPLPSLGLVYIKVIREQLCGYFQMHPPHYLSLLT